MNAFVVQTQDSSNESHGQFGFVRNDSALTASASSDEAPSFLSADLNYSNVVHFAYALDEHLLICIFDIKGVTRYANERFCENFKFSPRDILGKDYKNVIVACNSVEHYETIWNTIKQGKIWKGEIKNIAADGIAHWLDATVAPSGLPHLNSRVFNNLATLR